MLSFHPLSRVIAVLALATVAGGAGLPSAMAGIGEWEIGKSAKGRGERVCLPDPAILMQWEHRRQSCTRTVFNTAADRAELQYTCPAGGFGTSRLAVLTPRSVKVQTQGISGGLPFGYVIHARRIGDCSYRRASR